MLGLCCLGRVGLRVAIQPPGPGTVPASPWTRSQRLAPARGLPLQWAPWEKSGGKRPVPDSLGKPFFLSVFVVYLQNEGLNPMNPYSFPAQTKKFHQLKQVRILANTQLTPEHDSSLPILPSNGPFSPYPEPTPPKEFLPHHTASQPPPLWYPGEECKASRSPVCLPPAF